MLALVAALALQNPVPAFRALSAPRPASPRTYSLSNLKKISTGFMIWMTDHDDKFPKMTLAAVQAAFRPYRLAEGAFTPPAGNRYLFNATLSGVSQATLNDIRNTPTVWEEKAWPDGARQAGFADGSARRLTAAEWREVWRAETARRKAAKVR